MRVFELSETFSALRILLSWRTPLAILIFLGVLEATARLAERFAQPQEHQSLLYSTVHRDMDTNVDETRRVWRGNARGARGSLYRGERTQIAVFGRSTSNKGNLDQANTWAEQFAARLDDTHIDNYARNGASYQSVLATVRGIAAQKMRYDLVLLMPSWLRARSKEAHSAFHYSSHRWSGGAWNQLKQAFRDQIAKEPRLRGLAERITGKPWKKQMAYLDRWNEANRQKRLLGVQTIDRSVSSDCVLRGHNLVQMASAARKLVSAPSHVVVLLEPLAYDENALPTVLKKWKLLRPVGPDLYLSDATIAAEHRQTLSCVAEAARGLGATVVDLDAFFRPMLAERDDLFIDRHHFSKTGAHLTGKFLAGKLRGLLPQSSRQAPPAP